MGSRPVRGGERVYFVAVGVLALAVGLVGFFLPNHVARVLPFPVPPLHARFLGAMYLSGVTAMAGSALARRWRDVAVIPVMTALWTGGLGLISLLHLDVFPFERVQTWVWFGAYLVYPAIAIALMVVHRHDAGEGDGAKVLPRWARGYLGVQGAALIVTGALLLLAPDTMVERWPWAINDLLAQIYAAPFLSYGIGSVLLARRPAASEVRVGAGAMLVFAVGVLAASLIHRALFSFSEGTDIAWFTLFGVGAVGLAAVVLATREAEPA